MNIDCAKVSMKFQSSFEPNDDALDALEAALKIEGIPLDIEAADIVGFFDVDVKESSVHLAMHDGTAGEVR